MAAGMEPPSVKARGRRWPVVGAVAVIVIAAIVVWRTGGGSGSGTPGPATSAAPVPPTTSAAAAPPASMTPPAAGLPAFAYQPLWPFTGAADAAAWQQEYRSGGHQPWHLDAALTAQSFAQGYLGYSGLGLVTQQAVQGREAWIGVGYQTPGGTQATAAVVHLARIGTGRDAPWEVVGTRDSLLTLTQPAYGATVTSPVTAGGRITGVDENLVVRVRDLAHGVAGQVPGVPAGGQDTPWSVSVPFTATPGSVLTVAAATGGHVTDVERFAVTGVIAG
ncbi:MAG TPA: hypothetical protein VHC41_00635 [Mycobacteriales bacterium]|nr:hypothetical protein [Mycobacteriales bacterium]